MDQEKNSIPEPGSPERKGSFDRRDILKGLITLPGLGIFLEKLIKKRKRDNSRKNSILSELGIKGDAPAILPTSSIKSSSKELRLGLIG